MIVEDSNFIDSNLIDDSSSAEIGNESILNSTNKQTKEENKLRSTNFNLDWGLVYTFF